MKLKRETATPRTVIAKYINYTYGKAGLLNLITMNGYVLWIWKCYLSLLRIVGKL